MGTRTPKEHCQNGRADICLAGSADGTCCADYECDIDMEIRPNPLSNSPVCYLPDIEIDGPGVISISSDELSKTEGFKRQAKALESLIENGRIKNLGK